MNLNAILGEDKARCSHTSLIYPPSVKEVFKNFLLAGVLKNIFLTMIVVPQGTPTSLNSFSAAPSITYLLPTSSSFVLVMSST